ncbi:MULTISPECIES: hypothetical protein [unclassified Paraburkholderia]|nr:MULTISPECIES: hypothetical protein [unclassified Paraburkholderia]
MDSNNGAGAVVNDPLGAIVGANHRQRTWGAGGNYTYGPMVGGVCSRSRA